MWARIVGAVVIASALGVGAFLLFGNTSDKKGDSKQDGVALGAQVPDFVAHTLEGKEVRFSQLQVDADGRAMPVVVTFWSYKCPSGERAMDRFAAIAQAANEKGARFVGMCSYGESRDELAAYAQENGIGYPLYHDLDVTVGKLLGAEVVTETFVIDAEGKLVYRGGLGDADSPHPERALSQVLAGEPVDPAESRARG